MILAFLLFCLTLAIFVVIRGVVEFLGSPTGFLVAVLCSVTLIALAATKDRGRA